MMFAIKRARRPAVLALCLSLLLPAWPTEVAAQQRRVIVINAEQPNLWTLEQAHYLLAQMHRRNLDLRAKRLADLDPNEIAGLRFDVMRMLIEFGATFNQADLASNRLLADNQNFNNERRQQLITERDGLRRESLRLTGDIEALETEKAGTEDTEEQERLDARIAAKTNRLARVDAQIEQLNSEIATLSAPSGQLRATDATVQFDPNRLPKSSFDDAFKEAAAKQIEKFNSEPRLNATLRLDNFLQMQYEIIAKQLSLLRDELGPGERLVFLELPQTVNATHHESERKWAQSWWKIAGYTRRVPDGEAPSAPAATPRPVDPNHEPITVTKEFNSILTGSQIRLPVACEPARIHTFPGPKAFGFGDATATRPKSESSSIKVSAPGRVTKLTVNLNDLRHPAPQNLDLMLVGPQGQNVLLMSDVGAAFPANGVTLTLDDAAAAGLPNAAALAPGTYRPTNYDAADVFPKPAPAPLGGDRLSVFDGTDPNGTWTLYVVDDTGNSAGSLSGWSLNITTDCGYGRPRPMEVKYKDEFVNLDHVVQSATVLWNNYLNLQDAPKLENRLVRTVELIPRQSSLNVNDMNLRTTAGAFNFVLSTLFGFGSRLNIQRQREQFSQFVQQELYSAAFGKGAREFGWTFTPMPGMDRLQSGVRTTYAVVVVPEEATSLVLESNGCYFPRSYYPPNDFTHTKQPEWNVYGRTSRNCGGTPTKAFIVPIPSANLDGTNKFWVENISFQPVAKGKRVVVSVSGKNFSPQTGVLVNGVPLVHSIGLAQPLIRDDSEAGRLTRDEFKDAEVTGSVERIDSHRIIFTFKMPADFQGTPTITLVAPGRAVDLNWIPHINVNEIPDTRLDDYPRKMFGHGPGPDPFRIDRIRVTRDATSGKLIAQVTGAGFGTAGATAPQISDAIAKVLVNGSVATTAVFQSPSLLTVTFDAPRDDTIKLVMVSKNDDPKKVLTIESEAVANPAFLSVSDVEVTTYEAAEEDETPTLLVRIKGTGFTDSLQAWIAGKTSPLHVAVKSATEAVFTMPDPKAAAIVTLTDDAGQRAKIVVTRKTKKQE